MTSNNPDIHSIFNETIARDSQEERLNYLDEACGNDPKVRRRVEALLRAHSEAGNFFAGKSPASPANNIYPITEKAGDMIGPYKLREQIGEGGMGLVFVAEQTAPVRRKVALKLVKPGMDTKQVIARFEAERQALALMDHPNIAKVYDAGSTETGRPYFVMELVRGIPITEYCDKHLLTTRERLELFISVCRAVQHAHQKGIIHRDIKPGNVLVTQIDAKPAPKVIDFGVAKATNQQLTEQTIYTQFAETIGTPLYMSPEQAEMSNVDIDTRSDIYSLGVVLYELLTGSTPFDRETLKQANPVERMRIIREDEPLKPSARISTLNAADLSTISGHRSIVTTKLKHAIRGELDWIVMRAMEKDRNRRYESANALAADIERFLSDQPVQAGPPSFRYRLRKFTRRNRIQLLTSAAIVLVVASMAAFFVLDRKSQQENRENRRTELVQQIDKALTEAQQFRQQAAGGDLTALIKARDQARRAETLAESDLIDISTKDRVSTLLADMAEEELDRRVVSDLDAARIVGFSVDLKENNFQPHFAIPEYEKAFHDYGFNPQNLTPELAVERINSRPPTIQTTLLAGLDTWVDLLIRFKTLSEIDGKRIKPSNEKIEWLNTVIRRIDTDSTRMTIRQAVQNRDYKTLLEYAKSIRVDEHPPYFLDYLAEHLWNKAKKLPAAIVLLKRARKQYPSDFFLNADLGKALVSIEPHQLDESIRFQTVASALRPNNVGILLNLGIALMRKGRHDDAIDTFHRAIRLKPNYAGAYRSLGDALGFKGDRSGKIANYFKAHELSPGFQINGLQTLTADLQKTGHSQEIIDHCRKLIAEHPRRVIHYYQLGRIFAWEDDHPAAIIAFRKASKLDPNEAVVHNFLGVSLLEQGQIDDAIGEFHEAIRCGPDVADHYYNLAIGLGTKGAHDASMAAFEKAVQRKPEDARFYNQFAWLLATSPIELFRDPHQAVELATTATKKEKKNASFWNTLGVAQYRAENYPAAIEALQKSIKFGSDDSAAIDYLFLTMATLRLGDEPGARQWFKQSEKWMQNYKINNFVKSENEELKRFQTEAKELLATLNVANIRKLIEENPTEASYRYQLGLFLVWEKDLDSAIKSFQKAIDLKPDYTEAKKYLGEIHKNRGDILWQKGDWDAAVTEYVNACEHDPGQIKNVNKIGTELIKAGEDKANHEQIKQALAKLATWYLAQAGEGSAAPDLRRGFLIELGKISELQSRMGESGDSFRTFATALRLWAELAEEHPEQLQHRGPSFLLSVWTFNSLFLEEQERVLRHVLRSHRVSGDRKADFVTFGLIRSLAFVSLAMEKTHVADDLTRQLESIASRYILQSPNDPSCKGAVRAARASSFAIAAFSRDPKFFDLTHARALATITVQDMPSNDLSWKMVAIARYLSKDWHGAIKALDSLRVPRDIYPRYRELILACAYARIGRLDEARTQYANSTGNQPDPRYWIIGQTFFLREYKYLCETPVIARRPNSHVNRRRQ